MLLPLNMLNTIQFCPKYCIKDNCISPSSRLSNFVSFSGTIFFIIYFVYGILNISVTRDNGIIKIVMIIIDPIIFGTGFFNNFIHKISRANENISLVLKFQDVHRHLDDEAKFRHFIISNWIIVVSLLVFGISSVIVFGIMLGVSARTIISVILLMNFDANILYAIRIIQLLTDKVDLWNNHLVVPPRCEL